MTKQFEDYNVKRNRIVKLLEECLSKINDEKLSNAINEKKNQLNSDRFVVSVFGHFSNGKSTFLNSLMGFDHEVLKEDDNASTATITRLKFADSKNAKCNKFDVIYKNGLIDQDLDAEELGEFVARNGKEDVERTISEVILYIDSPFLKNGVEIVDTPGFNSTYEVHSEIALQQVKKSDAAIFLFSVDQPGNGEEFDFLKKIRKYMDRVFFVLNKVDKSDDNGNTERTDIFNKMNREGIDPGSKKMYLISALRARKAIAEKNGEMLSISGLEEFENSLTQYLTGEEFVKDRLLAPLCSVYTLIEFERESLINQIEACCKDRTELNLEIQNRKKEIREKEVEINNAKRCIASSVKSELLTTKTQIKDIIKKVGNDQAERLDRINSKFDIRLADFENFNRETFVMFSKEWEEISERLENRLLDILDTSIDNVEEFMAVSDAISTAIRSQLLLEQISIERPNFDFSELSKIDEEIKKADDNYNKAFNKVSNLYVKREDKNKALLEIEKIKGEMASLKNKKEKRIESLYMVQIEYGREMRKEVKYVERNKIGQFFLGSKRVEEINPVNYIDRRAYDNAQAEIKKIEKELEQNSKVKKEEIDKINARIDADEFRGIDREIERAEKEEQTYLDELIKKRENKREEMRAKEMQIITVEKNKFLNELKKALDDMGEKIITFLDQSQNNFISILSTGLDCEYEALAREKNNIEKMIMINDQTPEEIDKKLSELNKDKIELTECMNIIEQEREAV